MAGGVNSGLSKRIEQVAPELEKIISPSEPIHDLADGFGGPQGPAEGPLWWRHARRPSPALFTNARIRLIE